MRYRVYYHAVGDASGENIQPRLMCSMALTLDDAWTNACHLLGRGSDVRLIEGPGVDLGPQAIAAGCQARSQGA